MRSLCDGGTNGAPVLYENDAMARRSYGTGSLSVRRDARGRESWYGQWRISGRRVMRKLGEKRPPGSRRGLTRSQAERELQRRIDVDLRRPVERHVSVAEAGDDLL